MQNEDRVTKSTSIMIPVKLNNLLHRIDCKAAMVALATQHGGSLKRIRRSKNWLLTGTQAQLVEISSKLCEQKTQWIVKAIDNALPKPTFNLTSIMAANPAMTVNQLMAETGCSLVEARTAIDSAEGFNE